MVRKEVTFIATKLIKKPVEVKFKTQTGKPVDFVAKKKVPKKVTVDFTARKKN